MNRATSFPPFAMALVVTACTPQPTPAPASTPPFKPAASIQDLRVAIVDPAADALRESVSSETTAKGIEEKQPRTEEEWQVVRRHAIALQEAGNLLMMEGREVTWYPNAKQVPAIWPSPLKQQQ